MNKLFCYEGKIFWRKTLEDKKPFKATKPKIDNFH
jgi:hypothetical protein